MSWNILLDEEGGLDKYVDDMAKDKTWGDGTMIQAAVRLYNCPINVVQEAGKIACLDSTGSEDVHSKSLFLGFIKTPDGKNNHYVSLIPVSSTGVSSVCCSSTQVTEVRLSQDMPSPSGNIGGLQHDTSITIVDTNNQKFKLVKEAEDDGVDTQRCNSSSFSDSSDILSYDLPFHPHISSIQNQVVSHRTYGSRTLTFQSHWFKRFPWLHFSRNTSGVLCFYCAKAEAMDISDLASKREAAFTTTGFVNWKKALSKFEEHSKSQSHRFSMNQLKQVSQSSSVDEQLLKNRACEQTEARKCLTMIFTSVKYLARQGMALRGHTELEGNFCQLLNLRSDDYPLLQTWLKRKTDMTSYRIQNEILELYSHDIVRTIAASVLTSGCYGLIVDGTQDISKKEQISICLRYVDKDLLPHEEFVGLYDPPSTTGAILAECIFDVLLRLQLPVSLLRGQSYDGASNMSGQYNGCQAIIAERQPLALYVHCGAHCINLVSQQTVEAVQLVRDSLHILQELGCLFSQSIKCRTAFSNIMKSENPLQQVQQIKPLCPTRWLVRVKGLMSLLTQYSSVLECLDEMSHDKVSSSTVAARASGLHASLQKGNVLFGFKMALKILGPLESLNRSLQATYQTVSGMIAAVDDIIEEMISFRNDAVFDALMQECNDMIKKLDLEPIAVPRQRKLPKKYATNTETVEARTCTEHYRPAYFMLLDTAIENLRYRFGDSAGLCSYKALENVLLTGIIDEHVLSPYKELCISDLQLQMPLFRRKRPVKTVGEAASIMREMVPEVRGEFSEIEKLVRLLLVCPASSSEAERSFSALRRLKTWLRSTMTEARLNSVVVCNTHQDLIDSVDTQKLVCTFISRSTIRSNMFGAKLQNE